MGLNVPFIVQPVIYVVAVGFAWCLNDNNVKAESRYLPLSDMKKTVRMMLCDRPDIRWFVILVAILDASALSCFWLLQPKMQSAGIPLPLFGKFYTAKAALTIVISSVSREHLSRVNTLVAKTIVMVVLSLAALVAGLSTGWISVVVIFVGHAFVVAFIEPLKGIALRRLLPNACDNRTSELSVSGAVQSLAFAIVSPLLGVVTDSLSVGAAFLTVAGGCLCFGSGALYVLHRMDFGG